MRTERNLSGGGKFIFGRTSDKISRKITFTRSNMFGHRNGKTFFWQNNVPQRSIWAIFLKNPNTPVALTLKNSAITY